MLREKLIPALWLMCAAVLVGASIGFAARANADPATDYAVNNAARVCATLDLFPSFDGIMGIGQAIVDETGMGFYDAGQVIAMSVVNVCPEYVPLLKRFVASAEPSPVALYKEAV